MNAPQIHIQHTPSIDEIERLADDVIDLTEQIKARVAALRRQDERGTDDERRSNT